MIGIFHVLKDEEDEIKVLKQAKPEKELCLTIKRSKVGTMD